MGLGKQERTMATRKRTSPSGKTRSRTSRQESHSPDRTLNTRQRTAVMAVGAAFLPLIWTHAAWADPATNQLPIGGSVAAGQASISTSGSKMQIDQTSDKAILNWQNFSIGKDGWVNFSQPSASSVALNRSQQAAEIFG